MSKRLSVVADSTKFELRLTIDGPDWQAVLKALTSALTTVTVKAIEVKR